MSPVVWQDIGINRGILGSKSEKKPGKEANIDHCFLCLVDLQNCSRLDILWI